MFILSMRADKKKILIGIVCISVVVLSVILLFRGNSITNANAKTKGNTAAKTNEQRVSYLKSFGWEVSEEASEIVEVAIPVEFSDVYKKYNALQKAQGFDLSKYRGKRVKRYSYAVTNYPNEPKFIVANILVFEDEVIAGDICSLKADGFMHKLSHRP